MRAAPIFAVLVACAKAGEQAAIDAPAQLPDSGPVTDQCATDEFATDVTPAGELTCTPLDELTRAALAARCSVYLGWRDGCDACTTDPAKWGFAGTTTCTSGAGANNTCTAPNLGGDATQLFGLDFDGDVDGNDKLYGSLHCATAQTTPAVAPCPNGQLVVGVFGSSWTCAPVVDAVVDYVRASCSLYLGWQDNCDGCAIAPGKFGHAGDGGCQNGAGADDTCTVATLGTESIHLFGINPDGDVDGNDKLHVGLDCTAIAPDRMIATSTCPAGHFVTATLPDGSFQCDSVAPLVRRYFADHCTLTFGWQDNCDGCLSPPTKFGRVRVGTCTLGTGTDDTCGKFALAGTTVDMFGLNPDGNMDGNDVLYVGFSCR